MVTLSILPSPDRTTSYLPISCVLLFILCILLHISQCILSCWLLYCWITSLFFNVGNSDGLHYVFVGGRVHSNLPTPCLPITLLTSTLESIDARGLLYIDDTTNYHLYQLISDGMGGGDTSIRTMNERWRWCLGASRRRWCTTCGVIYRRRLSEQRIYTRSRDGNDGKDDKGGGWVIPVPIWTEEAAVVSFYSSMHII